MRQTFFSLSLSLSCFHSFQQHLFLALSPCRTLTEEEEFAESAEASSFLLALTLDRSFPGVELLEHQQRPLVRILWRRRGQAWQPRSGENPFVFVVSGHRGRVGCGLPPELLPPAVAQALTEREASELVGWCVW